MMAALEPDLDDEEYEESSDEEAGIVDELIEGGGADSQEPEWEQQSDEEDVRFCDALDMRSSESAVGAEMEETSSEPQAKRHRVSCPCCSTDPASWPSWRKCIDQTSEGNKLAAAALVLQNLKRTNDDIFNASAPGKRNCGTRPKHLQQALDSVARAVISPEMKNHRLLNATKEVTGFTDDAINAALAAHEQAETPARVFASEQDRRRATKMAAMNEMFLRDLIHEKCPLVELDRSKKKRWKKKTVLLGTSKSRISATCQPHIRHGTMDEIVDWVLASEELDTYLQSHPYTQVSRRLIRECICPCIRPARTKQCVCPLCWEFGEKREVFKSCMAEIRKTTPCACCNSKSPFVQAFQSGTAFRSAVCCKPEAYAGLAMPHNAAYTPMFYRLPCCVVELTETITTIPHHYCRPCTNCGLEFITPPEGCPTMSPENLATEAKWQKRQLELFRDRRGRWTEQPVLKEYIGTVGELWQEIQNDYKAYLLHRWVVDWTAWQFKLDVATFDGNSEILVLADFANQFTMHGPAMRTCEQGKTCNEYVCLVLHSPGPTEAGGGERPVVCDYIRIWSACGTSANFHHKALHDIAEHYRTLFASQGKTLKRIKIWSDGHSSTYKGFPNFGLLRRTALDLCNKVDDSAAPPGRMAYWPHPKNASPARGEEDAEGIDIFHRFFASYHACGPQDNVSWLLSTGTSVRCLTDLCSLP